MPLIKPQLVQQLTAYFKSNNKSPEDAASELADIIDAYIKSALVTVNGAGIAPPGIPTAGSPAAQVTVAPVATTVTGTGMIS
jgi:hypothetical protein